MQRYNKIWSSKNLLPIFVFSMAYIIVFCVLVCVVLYFCCTFICKVNAVYS